MVDHKEIEVLAGNEIGKMAYGTGEIPFIRTSDISNWEIKTDPKQGISEEIYSKYCGRQDVKDGDIFFVRDGTYLVGQSCIVTAHDIPCLFQSHILRFRLKGKTILNKYLFLALLNSPIVKSQIRARQFTADIIDSVGNRYNEIIFAVPNNIKLQNEIASQTQEIIENRASLRELIRNIPYWAQGIINNPDDELPVVLGETSEGQKNLGFLISNQSLHESTYIPKYYDPEVGDILQGLSKTHELISLTDLVKQKVISWNTGVEIGKMAYGTGRIPFIRTSDISNWELKFDPKQGISEEIYEKYCEKQDVDADDIFLVRDGTYLVGTSCILTENDTKILYCGGIYKLRVNKKEKLDPYLLLALLHSPIVLRQMKSKQFTRDIIDTLGKRLFEIVIPIPKDTKIASLIADKTRDTIQTRVRLRNLINQVSFGVQGLALVTEDTDDI
ncbi:MAG: hypothetical protein ABSE83_10165 [Methanobacterium sp.]